MKCDETRPTCINCKISDRQCVYIDTGSSSCPDTSTSPDTLPALTPPNFNLGGFLSAVTSISNSSTNRSLEKDLGPFDATLGRGDLFDLSHLALFHHIQTNLATIIQPDESTKGMTTELIQSALETPYLMNQLLALAALHLSRGPSARETYHQQATALQTRALTLFNEAKQEVSDSTCIPMFFFSSLLGVHILYETLQGPREHLGAVLDRFITYLTIHRGVRAVTNDSWGMIKESRLGSFLQQVEDAFPTDECTTEETRALHKMIDESNLNTQSALHYRKATATLQRAFSFHSRLKQEHGRPFDAPIAFCVTVNDEYINYLRQRQPEALVVLAFYAVMLHWNRHIWIFGDGGQYLIRAITEHLGTHWAGWLRWPNAVLKGET